jgi:general secretion pathway protein F
MKAFAYTALTAEGKRRKGRLVAENAAHASEQLRAQGLFTTDISVDTAPSAKTSKFWHRSARLNPDLRAVFTRQMAVLLSAGLPVDAALEAVRTTGGNGPLATFSIRTAARILDGQPLSNAIEAANAGFEPYFIASLRAGEVSGDVDQVFEELAEHLENLGTDRAQIAAALIYPAFVAAVSLIVCAILMTTVAPEIVHMFEISGRPLPKITQTVLSASDWIRAHFGVLVLVLIGFGAAMFFALRIPRYRDLWDRLRLRIPILGSLIRLSSAAQYLRTLALVIASRQTVLGAAKNAADVLNIQRFEREAGLVSEAVQRGEDLSSALGNLSFLPPAARQLVSAGEKSARVARMTERAAALVENSLSLQRKRISALLEPALMMVVGGFVLVIVLAVLLPIFDLQAVVTQ